MSKLKKVVIALIVLILVIVAAFSFAVNAGDGNGCDVPLLVYLSTVNHASLDEHFIAKVMVGNICNFDAANYDITYNPDVLEVIDVLDGEIGRTIIPVSIWGYISPDDVTSGRIRIINNVQWVPGVDGTGYLAEIEFKVISITVEATDLWIGDGILGDNQAMEIETIWLGTSISLYAAGDANVDGVINSLDLTKVERIILGIDIATLGADANIDGNINAMDLTKIEMIIVGA